MLGGPRPQPFLFEKTKGLCVHLGHRGPEGHRTAQGSNRVMVLRFLRTALSPARQRLLRGAVCGSPSPSKHHAHPAHRGLLLLCISVRLVGTCNPATRLLTRVNHIAQIGSLVEDLLLAATFLFSGPYNSPQCILFSSTMRGRPLSSASLQTAPLARPMGARLGSCNFVALERWPYIEGFARASFPAPPAFRHPGRNPRIGTRAEPIN